MRARKVKNLFGTFLAIWTVFWYTEPTFCNGVSRLKTKTWIILLCALLAVSLGLSIWLLMPGKTAAAAEIWLDGTLYRTVDLAVDQEFEVQSDHGTNTITVKDGKIAVTAASCPDHHCMQRGFCDGGTQIVCLPNRLVVKFTAEQEVDGVVG